MVSLQALGQASEKKQDLCVRMDLTLRNETIVLLLLCSLRLMLRLIMVNCGVKCVLSFYWTV